MRAKVEKNRNDFNVIIDGNLALASSQGEGTIYLVEFIEPELINLDPILRSTDVSYGIVEREIVTDLIDIHLPMVSASVNTVYGIVEREIVTDLIDIHLPMVSSSIDVSYGIVEREIVTDLIDIHLPMVSASIDVSYGIVERNLTTDLIDIHLPMVSASMNTTYGIVERNLTTDLMDIHLPMVSASVNTVYGIIERYFEPNNITRDYLSDYPNFSWLSFNGLANIQNTDSANPISYDIGNAESPVFIGPHSTDLVINLDTYTSVEVGETKSIKIIPQMGKLVHGDIIGLDGNNTIAGTTITYRPDNNSKEVDSFYYAVIGTSSETGLSMESNVSTCFVETSHRERNYVSTANAFDSLGFASSLELSIPDQDSPVFSSYTVPDIDKNVTASFRLPASDYETVAITEQPTSGVLNYMASQETSPVKTGPYFTYQPLADTPVDFNDDVFTFTVKLMGVDPAVSYVSSQFTLRVKNTPPQVDNDYEVLIDEDTDTGYSPLPISGLDPNGHDVNGDSIFSEIVPVFGEVTYPQNGAAVLSSNSLQYKYTPNLHWHGEDRFYYRSRETTNSIWSETKEIRIQVDSKYDSPQATVLTGGVSNEGGYIAYTMVGTSNELEGDYDLRYQLMQEPTENGTVIGYFTNTTEENELGVGETSPLLESPVVEIHADDPDYFGTGTWKYRVVDINRTLNGSLLADAKSSIVECSYLFNNVNDAPTAIALTPTVNEDQLTRIDLSFADAYNETGTYSYSINSHPSGPNAGVLSGGCTDDPSQSFVNYLSKSNYVGTDTFTYIVNDGVLNSAAASVTVNVLNTPDAPVGDDLIVLVNEDVSVNFTVPHVDVDPGEESNLRVFWVGENPPASRGTIGLTGGNWNSPGVFQYSFTPAPHNTISTFADYYLWDGTWIDSSESMEVGNDGNPVAASWPNARTSEQKRITFNIDPFDDPMEWVAHPTTMSVQEQQTGDPATYGTIDIQAIDPDVLGSNILTGQAPSYDIKTQGTKGVATIAPVPNTDTWRITYTLNDVEYTQSTTDTFTYRATNSTNPEITEVCTVTILPLDDMPTFTASPINIACTEVEGFTFLFAEYITDPDSTAFDIVKFEYEITDAPNPSYTKTWNPSGLSWNDANMPTVTYEWDDINHQLADSSVTQTDSFKWRVRDQAIGSAWSDEVTVNITIQGVNSAPVITAAPTALSLHEDTISYFNFTATDAESTPIVYTFTQPNTGVVAVTTGAEMMSGTHKYTPPADYYGNPGTFTMSASDGVNTTSTSSITIDVISVNDHPIAESQSLGTNEDVALSITLTGHDHPNEDSPITFKDVSAPANGILTEHSSFSTNGIITYTPNQDYHGADSFTFKVNDGTNDSVAATITLAVHDINDIPIADPLTLTGNARPAEGGVKSMTLTGTDIENNPLSFHIWSLPDHGTLHSSESAANNGTGAYILYQEVASTVWYKHDSSENHVDTFNFKVKETDTDNLWWSTVAGLVTINVIPVNDAPVASAQSVTVAEDSTDNVITLTTYASDVDTDDSTLTYTINQPSHGTLTTTHLVDDKEIEYTPNPDFYGTDVVTFVANDGSLDSNTGVITITVTPVNDPIVVNLTKQSSGVPNGPDGYIFEGTEDEVLEFVFPATDVDGGAITYEVGSDGIDGWAKDFDTGNTRGPVVKKEGTTNTFQYTPEEHWNGNSTYTKIKMTSTNSTLLSDYIWLRLSPVDDPPVITGVSPTDNGKVVCNEQVKTDFQLEATDEETSESMEYFLIDNPTHGYIYTQDAPTTTLTESSVNPIPSNLLIYQGIGEVAADIEDTAKFKVRSQGGSSGLFSEEFTVTFLLKPVNDPPVAVGNTHNTQEDTFIDVILTASDVEDSLIYQIVTDAGANASLQDVWASNDPYIGPNTNLASNQIRVHPTIDSVTDITFTWKVYDGTEYSDTVTETVTITPVNDPPVAANLPNIAVMEDSSVVITLAGTDTEGATLTYHITDMPDEGALSNYSTTSSSVTYTPSIQSLGWDNDGAGPGRETTTDTFKYKVNDGTVDSTEATVTITISGVNDAPVVNDFAVTVDESSSDQYDWVFVDLTGRGSDVDTNDNLWYGLGYIPEWSEIRRGRYSSGYSSTGEGNLGWHKQAHDNLPDVLYEGAGTVNGTTAYYTDYPSFWWRPANANDTGVATLTYYAYDGGDGSIDDQLVSNDDRYSATKNIIITINPVNDPPVATSFSKTFLEDSEPNMIELQGNDPVEGQGVNFYIVSLPSHGYLLNVNDYNDIYEVGEIVTTNSSSGYNNQVRYQPFENYNGSDSFKFEVWDGPKTGANAGLGSDEATVTITVSAVDDAPTASNFTISGCTEDTAKNFSIPSDKFGNVDPNETILFSFGSPASGGTISGTSAASSHGWTYTPPANWSGTDSATFTVTDNTTVPTPLSASATVSFVVAATADSPATDDQVVNYTEDTAISFWANAGDPDWPYGDYVKSVTIHAYASNWGASLLTIPDSTLGKSLYWTFNRNIDNDYANTYVDWSFTDINDVQSNQSRINFNGTSVEDPTVWESYPPSDTVSGNENSGASIVVTATDADNTITYGIEEQLTRFAGAGGGTANGDPTLTHPSAPASGSFSISAVPNSDGSWYGTCKVFAEGSSKLVKTITVNLDSVNETPTAQDASYNINEDSSHAVDLDGLIADEETSDAQLTITNSNPGHGTVSIDANTHIATFSPASNNNTNTSYTYTVSDGVNSVTKTISYNIASINDLPSATAQTHTVNEDETVDIYLSGADVESSSSGLTYSITADPNHYSTWAHQSGNHWKYRGAADNNNNVTFGWKVTDAHGGVASTTDTINITAVADTVAWLTGGDYTVTIQEDGSDVIQRGAADPDGTSIVYSIVDQPPNGTLAGNGTGQWTYTPNANFNSTSADIGRIKAVSGGDTIYKYMKYTVTAVDDTPVANNQSVSVSEDSYVDITLTGSDVENQTLTFGDHSTPSHGTLTNHTNAGAVRYTPTANYNGDDSFTFTVSTTSPAATSSAGTVSITVNAQNDAPVASNVSVTTDEDTAKVITLSGSDPVEESTVTYHKVTDPSNGSVGNITNNSITYTPNSNYNGADSFTYKVNDGNLDSNIATVSITVDPVADNPTATLADFSVNEDTSITVNLSGTDPDALDSELTGHITAYGSGHFSPSSNNKQLTYWQTSHSSANSSFDYYVKSAASSGSRTSSQITVTITVNPVPDNPYVNNHSFGAVYRGSTQTATLGVGDHDGNYSHSDPTNRVSTLTIGSDASSAPFGQWKYGSTVTAYDSTNRSGSGYSYGLVTDRTPTINSTAVSTAFETAVDVAFSFSSIDAGQTHTYTVSNVVGGTTSGTGATVTFTPNAGFRGAGSLTQTVSDGAKSSSTTVPVTVNPPAELDDPTVSLAGSTGNAWPHASVELSPTFGGTSGWTVTDTSSADNSSMISTTIGSGPVVIVTPNAGYPDSAITDTTATITRSWKQANLETHTATVTSAAAAVEWLARPADPGAPPVIQVTSNNDSSNPIPHGGALGCVIRSNYTGYDMGAASWSVGSPWSLDSDVSPNPYTQGTTADFWDSVWIVAPMTGSGFSSTTFSRTWSKYGYNGTHTHTFAMYFCHSENTIFEFWNGTTRKAIDLKIGDILRTKSFTQSGEQSELSDIDGTFSSNQIHSMLYDVKTIIKSLWKGKVEGIFVINNTYELTGSHPVFVMEEFIWEWKAVNELKIGDILFKADGNHETVDSIIEYDGLHNVVMVGVEEEDTYLCQGLLHHNK